MCLFFLFAVGAAALAGAIDTTSPTNPVAPAKPVRDDDLHGRGRSGPSWSGELRAAVVPRGDAEHVVLADCKAPNNLQSSQMAYYNGPPNNAPSATTVVSKNKSQAWAGSNVTGVFPDKVSFTADIPVTVSEGQYAGVGYNDYVDFNCYMRFKNALYTTNDGIVCDGVYDCDHTSPPVSSSSSSHTPTVASTAPLLMPTTSLPSTPIPTTPLTLATTNTKRGGTSTSLRGPTGSPAADSISTKLGDPSSSSSAALAAAATDSHVAPDTGHDGSLTRDQNIGIGVGVGVGVPALLVALLAWLFPRNKNVSEKMKHNLGFSQMLVFQGHTTIGSSPAPQESPGSTS